MGVPTFELNEDHLRVKLDAMGSVTALTGDLVIPYSTIASVDVVPPEWPPWFPAFRVGMHVHKVVAKGRFGPAWTGPKKFLWFDRKSARVLRIRLAGHASLSEVQVDVPDAEALQARIEARRGKR